MLIDGGARARYLIDGPIVRQVLVRDRTGDPSCPNCRTTLGHLLGQRRAEADAIWNDMRRLRSSANQALSADPYDLDKAAAALAAVRDKFKELRDVVEGTVLEIMPKLPAEQRRKMLERRSALWRL